MADDPIARAPAFVRAHLAAIRAEAIDVLARAPEVGDDAERTAALATEIAAACTRIATNDLLAEYQRGRELAPEEGRVPLVVRGYLLAFARLCGVRSPRAHPVPTLAEVAATLAGELGADVDEMEVWEIARAAHLPVSSVPEPDGDAPEKRPGRG
jgi:hypothetical protein